MMQFRKTITLVCTLAIAFMLNCSAKADSIVTFSIDGGATYSNTFEVETGNGLTFEVYLSDDQAGGILETDGLFGFGLAASTTPTNLGAITAAAIAPVFDFGITETFTSSNLEWEDAVFTNTIPTGQSILLGEITFDTFMDGSTVFTFGHNAPGSLKWLAGDGVTPLDETVFGSGATGTFDLTINAAPIPEPGVMTLLAIGCAALLTRRNRCPA